MLRSLRGPVLVAVTLWTVPTLVQAQTAPPPRVDQVSPADAPTPGGRIITISGSGFGTATGANAVLFGDQVGQIVDWTDVTIEVATPEADPGTVDLVVVEGVDGQRSAPVSFPYGPLLLESVAPDVAPVGGGITLTVAGRNFGRASASRTWTVGGVVAEEQDFVPHVRAEILVPSLPATGAQPVELVVNGETASNPVDVTVVAATPQIDALRPASAPTRGGVTITIEGRDFGVAPGTVQFGSAPAETPTWTDARIEAIAPEGSPGQTSLTVTSADGSATSSPATFGYDPPVIESIDPVSGPVGGGIIITVAGRNFGTASTPRTWLFGSTPASEIQPVDHELATVVLPAAGAPGPVEFFVRAGTETSNAVSFEYRSSVVIGDVIPATAPTSGGTTLTIIGSGFGAEPGTVAVNQSAAPVQLWSDTDVVATVPEGAPGPASIRVTTAAAAVAVDDSSFGYGAPEVESLEPATLPAVGGTTLTIRGGNFGRASDPRTVTVDGVAADGVIWIGHEQLLVTAPPQLPGREVPVCVVSHGVSGSCATLTIEPPRIDALTPASGPMAGGTIITVVGENFGVDRTTPRTVSFGDVSSGSVQFVDDRQLLAELPEATQPGPVGVFVDVAGAAASLPDGFTYEQATGVDASPSRFALYPNEPNPFSSRTTIAMDLPRASDYVLTVFDVRGRMVRQIEDRAGPGRILLGWDGTDALGRPLASGVYFYRLEAPDFREARRMVLMR
ncbi:MAG TPA: IPT/TIG domain-containing protein [Candidatus Krumholzibacteria bacterium]|nr:IPT/TIG domain-containing protein [Candidatus Krumholzibacteria bacterium]